MSARRDPMDEPAPPMSLLDALDPPEMQARREKLIKELRATGDLRKPSVIDAMLEVPRHLFIAEGRREVAYENHPVGIGHEQTISQPTVVAIMTEALELGGDERVLEIGTGSGYQSAVLSRLAREVYSVERFRELGTRAATMLARIGYANVHVRIADGHEGWAEKAPFDRVIFTAAPREVPQTLVDQLAEGGILIGPVGTSERELQVLVRGVKERGRMTYKELCRVSFVPMVGGLGESGTIWN